MVRRALGSYAAALEKLIDALQDARAGKVRYRAWYAKISAAVAVLDDMGLRPGDHVVTVLQSGADIPSHGTLAMPVWGPILANMNQTQPHETLLRMSNLSRYLETVQVK